MSESNQSPKDEKSAQDQTGNQQPASAEFDKLVKEAEEDTKTRQPGDSTGNHNNQHNNGRGGGK